MTIPETPASPTPLLQMRKIRKTFPGTVALAWRQTLTNRWTAVATVSTSITQRMAIIAGSNSRARPTAMSRSARSIRPPRAS